MVSGFSELGIVSNNPFVFLSVSTACFGCCFLIACGAIVSHALIWLSLAAVLMMETCWIEFARLSTDLGTNPLGERCKWDWAVGGSSALVLLVGMCTVPGSGLRIALFKFRQSSPV